MNTVAVFMAASASGSFDADVLSCFLCDAAKANPTEMQKIVKKERNALHLRVTGNIHGLHGSGECYICIFFMLFRILMRKRAEVNRYSIYGKPSESFPPINYYNIRRYHEIFLSSHGLNTWKKPKEFRKQCKFIVKISKPYYYWYEGYRKSAFPHV